MSIRQTTLYLSHGGGPLPLLGDPKHQELIEVLNNIASTHIKKPSAILVISAHWEETIPTITANATPGLIYDYSGFPEESYHIQYPAIGHPELATRVQDCLNKAGIQSHLDEEKGFDHGMFVPLKIMYPDADIPCVQLSLVQSLDPAVHIDIGKALSQLDYPDLLIVGSGFSFHNVPAFFIDNSVEAQNKNIVFEQWLNTTITEQTIEEYIRKQRLINWAQAPYARYCHPREEHLLPLHVCYGINQLPSTAHFSVHIMGKLASMFIWK